MDTLNLVKDTLNNFHIGKDTLVVISNSVSGADNPDYTFGIVTGVVVAFLGTAFGSFIQWKFNKQIERKETRRALISIRAEIEKILHDFVDLIIDLRFSELQYQYYSHGISKKAIVVTPSDIVDTSKQKLLLVYDRHTKVRLDLIKYCTEFSLLYGDANILRSEVNAIADYPINKFDFSTKPNEFFVKFNLKEEANNEVPIVKKEFAETRLQNLFDKLDELLKKY